MKKIYVCSRVSGDYEKNIEKIKEYARFIAIDCGAIPIAPHMYFSQFLNDSAEEKAFGLMSGLYLLSECDELWYFGDSVNAAMVNEILAARENEIQVRYISDKMIEKIKKENGGKRNETE